MASCVLVAFSDHASVDQRRMILGFMNALSGQVEVVGAQDYTFLLTRTSRVNKARDSLLDWERDGLIRWTEAPV